MPSLKDRLRENKNIFIRDNMKVDDINGPRKKNFYQSMIKDIMNVHKDIRGAEPKTTKPKRYNENNSFDYSDVNISRRVIRKMVHSSLFDHKPYERAKYMDKISLGNKFINNIDPVDTNDPGKSMSAFDKPKPLYQSVDMRGSSMSQFSKLNKTLEAPHLDLKAKYKSSRRQRLDNQKSQQLSAVSPSKNPGGDLGNLNTRKSMYTNNLAQSVNTLSPGGSRSLKDFHSCAPFAGRPSKHDAFDLNRNPYHKVNNDVYRQLNASQEIIMQSAIEGRNPLMIKSRHFHSNERQFPNPYANGGS
jgi:hypothetical protein